MERDIVMLCVLAVVLPGCSEMVSGIRFDLDDTHVECW